MLFIDRDEHKMVQYMVTNDIVLCLIGTTNRAIANFIDRNSIGNNPKLKLTVGDLESEELNSLIWKHVRRFN